MSGEGFVVWITGLSGAGKSTLASGVAGELAERGVRTELLDGDEVRTWLTPDLGFTKADRDANVLRIGNLARLLSRQGTAVVVAAISPYAEARARVRSTIDRFVEVHVDCPMEELIRRDPKGLYARALAGALENFTGVSDPYEVPEHPEVRVDSAVTEPAEALAVVIEHLRCASLIPASARTTGVCCDPPPGAHRGGNETVFVEKPWGHEHIWYRAEYAAKTLHVLAGRRLSLQMHREKVETLFVHAGHPLITIGEQARAYAPGDAIHVQPGTTHRIEAPRHQDAILFEVSTPQLEDIVRFEDDYGRVTG